MKIKAAMLFVFISALVVPRCCLSVAADYVRGEIIVKFKEGVGDDVIRKINASHRSSVIYTSPFARFMRVRIPRNRTVEEMIELYGRNPNVEYAVANSIARAHLVPDDPFYDPCQWNFDDQEPGGNPYGGANGGGINLEPAWDVSRGLGVVVAVVDSGVAYQDYRGYRKAPDLWNTTFVPGWDFVNRDSHPNDDNSHGTHVTGTIAQNTNNSMGVAGVAFACSIMPVKVLNSDGEGTLQLLVDGIYYAVDHGAHIINMSLGWSPGFDPGEPLKEALDYAYDHDVTVVCSSGNDNASTVSYPAAYWTTIAVGATRYDETRAPYSNYGSALDLTAPGGDFDVDQNGDGYGDGILQNTFDPITQNPQDFWYWFFDGTSMAAPHVSGVAALLIANGVVTPDDIRHALQSTAEDKGASGWDTRYGWGIVDAYAALNAPPSESRQFTLSDDTLMTFDDTFVKPFEGWADVVGRTDPARLGVEYSVDLLGAWDVEVGVGGTPSQTDLSGYSSYVLTFTNISAEDSFSVNVYVKTGPERTHQWSPWWTLLPGMSAEVTLDLTTVSNVSDVREIGFGLEAWVGNQFGMADFIEVKVQRPVLE